MILILIKRSDIFNLNTPLLLHDNMLKVKSQKAANQVIIIVLQCSRSEQYTVNTVMQAGRINEFSKAIIVSKTNTRAVPETQLQRMKTKKIIRSRF